MRSVTRNRRQMRLRLEKPRNGSISINRVTLTHYSDVLWHRIVGHSGSPVLFMNLSTAIVDPLL